MESFAGPARRSTSSSTAWPRRSPTPSSAASSTSACPTARVRSISGSCATWSGRSPRGSTGPAPYQSPWGALFSVGGDSAGAGYFLSDDQRLLFILAEPESEKGSFTGDRAAIEGIRGAVARLKARVPQREGRRHRQARALQRRDDRRLPRQRAGDLPGLRPDPGPAAARLPARRQADRHAGRADAEPLLVDRRGHAGDRPPVALLGDVHLDRDRHRHRLRHLLPLPLRGGAVPGPQPPRGARDHRRPHRPRDAARRASPRRPRSTC